MIAIGDGPKSQLENRGKEVCCVQCLFKFNKISLNRLVCDEAYYHESLSFMNNKLIIILMLNFGAQSHARATVTDGYRSGHNLTEYTVTRQFLLWKGRDRPNPFIARL